MLVGGSTVPPRELVSCFGIRSTPAGGMSGWLAAGPTVGG